MSTGAIANAANAAAGSSATPNGFSDLSSDEFIRIMLAELENQDPLDPNDSQALMEQISSLRNIESQISLQESLESLVLQNQISVASGMIGKIVEGLDANNDAITGQVTSIRVIDGDATLELNTGQRLAVDRVTRVSSGN